VGEEAGPDRVAAAEGFAEPHGCAGQQVQRMPERRRLRRRPDEQFPVDLSRPGPRRAGRATGRAAPGRLAASGGPSTLAARSGRRCCGTRRRGPWRSGADRLGAVGPPAAPARWAAGSGWSRSHGSGPAAGSRSQCPPRRPARCGYGRSRTGAAHRGTAGRASPASRVCSARSRLTTTITACVSVHDSQHCLPHAVGGRGGLVLHRANSRHAPSRTCRRGPRPSTGRRPPAEPGRGSVLARSSSR